MKVNPNKVHTFWIARSRFLSLLLIFGKSRICIDRNSGYNLNPFDVTSGFNMNPPDVIGLEIELEPTHCCLDVNLNPPIAFTFLNFSLVTMVSNTLAD